MRNAVDNKTNQDSNTTRADSSRAPIELLADEYLARLRAGGRPRISDYVRAHPELAEEIRELFPTLAMLENMAPSAEVPEQPTLLGDPAPTPVQIGEYRILREIGRGGMGIVYEAEHDAMHRRVALKVLPGPLAAREANLQRFWREARAAGRLHHSNIVPVFEVGEHEGLHFYAMQFIHGQNLDVVIEEIKRLRQAGDCQGSAPGADDGTEAAELEPLGRTVALGMLSGIRTTSRKSDGDIEASSAVLEPGPGPPVGNRAGSGTNQDLSVRQTRASSGSPTQIELVEEGAADCVSDLSQVGHNQEDYYQRVARIGLQVAEALDYAHGQGVLHRDIKPSNLILDTAGVVWITDFGLAKHAGDNVTHTGDVVGTLRYMAPERFRGEADERSDLYSLGLTLYELCTLQYAFQASDRAELVRQLTSAQPLPPRKLDPRIPRDLETVVMKAMAREPGSRFGSARALAEELRLFLSDRPIRSRRSSSAERVFRWCRRNPVLATLSAAVALLLTTLVVSSLVFGWVAKLQAVRLERETIRARGAERSAELARREATLRLYESSVDRAHSHRWSGRPGQHFASLDAIAEAVQILPTLDMSADQREQELSLLRNEAVAAMPLVDVRETRSWEVDRGEGVMVAFPPDFASYARTDDRGNIELRRSTNDELLRTLPGPGERAWVLRFSPDGRWLCVKYHRGGARPTLPVVRVWKVGTGELVRELADDLYAAPVAFQADSQVLAVGFGEGVIRGYRLPEFKETFQTRIAGDVGCLAFAPGDRYLAASESRGNLAVVIDMTTLEQRELPVSVNIKSLAWRPGHRELALGGGDGTIFLQSLEQKHDEQRRLIGHTRAVTRMQFLCQGRILASSSWDGTTRLWCAETGRESLRIEGQGMVDSGYALDHRVGFTREAAAFGIWEVADGMPLRFLYHLKPTDRRWSVRFHPGNPRLLASATSRGVELWDLDRQQLITVLGNRDVRSAVFVDGGRSLVTTGADGIQRWDLSLDESASRTGELRVVVTEPHTLQPGGFGDADVDAAGQVMLAQAPRDRAIVLDLTRPELAAGELAGHLNLDRVAVDPQGRWGVTTTWKGTGVQLWDIARRRKLYDLVPDAGSATARFSPDGGWLAATTGKRLYIWRCGDWHAPARIDRQQPDGWPAMVSFSPDGSLLAAPFSRFVVQLIRPQNAQPLARLSSPVGDKTLEDYAFSHDGRLLAVADAARIHVWDLVDLRQRLRDLNLIWPDAGQIR